MEPDAWPDSASARARRKLQAEFAAQDAAEEEADLLWLLASDQGRRVVWRKLSRAHVFRSAFDPEPVRMAFVLGQREDGLRLVEAVSRYPKALALMMEEANERERTRNAILERASDSD